MQEITAEELDYLLKTFHRSAIHLETRDAYGTETELPFMAKWMTGEPDDLSWLDDWCATVRDHVNNNRFVRRARIVSEPLSDYQRWSYSIAHRMVDAGEDIRWVPRRTIFSITIPGNDFYLLDGRLVIFLHYSGGGLNTAFTSTTSPADIDNCLAAFERIWAQAIPHSEYQPI